MIGVPYYKNRFIFNGIRLFFGLMLTFIFCVAHSIEIRELYEAEVPIADKSEQKRKEAMQAALLQVISKISGQRKLTDSALVKQALQRADHYVEQFRYRIEPNIVSEQHISPTGKLMFWVQFDSSSIDKFLREANIQVWGQTKPSVLAWLAIEGDQERTLLSAEDHTGLSDVLYASATERGVSIILPLLDLDDRSRIDDTDVWSGSRERILAASERYAIDTVLVGRIFPSYIPSIHWEVHWELLGGEITDNWTTHADTPSEVLQEGIHETIDILITRYAGSKEESATDVIFDPVRLMVLGMKTIGDYAKVQRYLGDLQSGTKVYVTQVDVDRVSFRLLVPGGQAKFDEKIELGTVLTKMAISDFDNVSVYQFLP
uniref:DUF2066 domain-containing protein n=1 Tax=Candidatus Kentrum sp. TUN TaxID=2126343 RepID=A0A451A3U0_9GAMM|nr:MAG: hypothetical protein BECKTUN1418F_GA0071002_10605 [Candidatus Kentron sp. TUN]VFK58792.1 MAG: hypothetical protein BECKTUN1418D_GA0071000_10904 [Candidatus Kentron sp. TUN]VFK60662.1 MAG: hypothetical protein BECKTUN1418E_GA0071001_10595 [Candidatus Kentron sp. TUN]